MAKVLGRVTGTVLDTDDRSGTSKAGNPYRIRSTSVIVLNRAIIVVTLKDDQPLPIVGEEVDWLCDLSSFQNEVQGRFVQDWPSLALAGKRADS